MSTVVFVLPPRVHLLDVSGPAEVFDAVGTVSGASGEGYRLRYVGESPQVTSAQGLPLAAEVELPLLHPSDIVVVPGWRTFGGNAVPLQHATLRWVAAHAATGGQVASICSGAFALGAAGLLDGRRCTTHHEISGRLAQRYPRARVIDDVLFVRDGAIATSAGIASGIDLALDLVAERDGPAVASAVARTLVVYGRRNGQEPQRSEFLRYRDHVVGTVHRAQDLIEQRLAEPLPLPQLAAAVEVSPRTLTRAFDDSIGMTPLRYQQTLRVARAERLIDAGYTVEAAARRVGFGDARMLRRLRARG